MGKTYKNNFDKGPKLYGSKTRKKKKAAIREATKGKSRQPHREDFEHDEDNFEKFSRKR